MKTMKDVAARVGVSVASVSRAINDPSTVSSDLLRRINEAIRELGYAPNKIARSLKVQTSKSVGVVIPDITNLFHVKVIKGAESVLAAAGYTLFIMDTEESPEKESRALRDLLDRRIDGLVFTPALHTRRLPRPLADHPTPLVFVDRFCGTGHDCIRGNSFSGISLLFHHLIARGRRRIALISGSDASQIGHERNAAYRALVAQHGLDDDPGLIRLGEFTTEAGYRAAQDLLDDPRGIDGAVATSNLLGIGALKAFRDHRVSPEDIELAVFDEIGELVDPPVAHVRQQAYEMGALATRFLLERIQGRSGPARTVLFDPLLFGVPQPLAPIR